MLAIPPADAGKTKRTDQLSAAAAALKCAYALMQQRIIASPSDMMAVLLYGTEQTKFQDDGDVATGTLSYPNCYLLVDLNVPSAEDVKALRGLVDGESVASPLVAATERVPMSNVLFCANQIFTTRTPNFASRRLFIVTDDDDPHRTNSKLKSAAAVRARDLYDLGVVIELFPISKPGHDFDRSKFYSVRLQHNLTRLIERISFMMVCPKTLKLLSLQVAKVHQPLSRMASPSCRRCCRLCTLKL